MDFSLNVDPAFHTTASSLSPLDLFLAGQEYRQERQLEFDLFGDDDEQQRFLPDVSSSMVSQIMEEPSQFAVFSLSPTLSPSPSYPSSLTSASDSSDENPPPQRTQPHRSSHNDKNSQTSTTRQNVRSLKPYPTGSDGVKRHQTKLACVWCRKLSKKCDTQRPCARCVQFNRCSECVDAPARKPRTKGVDRGTYKRTRDLATQDFQEALVRRRGYVARVQKMGRNVNVGLSAEEILHSTKRAEVRIAKVDARRQPTRGAKQRIDGIARGDSGVMKEIIDLDALDSGAQGALPTPAAPKLSPGGLPLQGGLLPFTGPLESLFAHSTLSPEMDDISLESGSSSLTTPLSRTDSLFDELFDESSSTDTSILFPDSTSPSMATWFDHDMTHEWKAIELFPNLMGLVLDAQLEMIAQNGSKFNAEGVQMESDIKI